MAKKILIVDDEAEILGLVKYSVEKEGFEVSTCDDGRQALEAIARVKPDVLILDVMLPGVDGYSLQTKIAEDPALKTIPVIVLTALEPSKSLFQGFPQVTAFLTKPLKNDELLQSIHKAVGVAVS